MSASQYVYVVANAAATPASAATAQIGASVPLATDPSAQKQLLGWDFYQIEIDITAGAGGTTDITLDRSFDNGVTWREFFRTAAVPAATTVHYSAPLALTNTITAIGVPATAATAPVIANGASAGGSPGPMVRARATGGAGTTGAGSATVLIVGIKKRR